MPPRLKVFQAHLGFFDTVVAAPSQKAALDAWGSSQNLFRDGAASVAADPQAIKAALQKPGVVLKRLVGSGAEFVEQPPLPASASSARPKKTGKPKPPPKPGRVHAKPATDRSKIEAAEVALVDLREEQTSLLAELKQREQALRNERKAHEQEFDQREKALRQERQTAERELDRREMALRHERESHEREFARKESELEHRLAAARRHT